MDHEKMGKFICEMRKSQNLTQKELAAGLKVTDKAVSKWERGISCPDVALLMPLAKALGVTASELLNGEKSAAPEEEEQQESLVEATLLYSNRSTAGRMERIKKIAMAVVSLLMLIAAGVCLLCDFCVTGGLTWSLLVIASLLLGWVLLLPLLKANKKAIRKFILVLSAVILPYLWVLGRLLNAPAVFRLGAMIALLSLAGIWCVYGVFYKLSHRKLSVWGVVCLIILPLLWGINSIVAWFFGEPLEPETILADWITSAVLMIVSIFCFMGKYFKARREK